ncbi:Uncharacterized protein dnm_037270 [Desulfonema magnum]|uniref:Uncharacterized protein n=1 Tax=Desulfonema magnum TaxID=45655 RepID=A0A975BM45_9BACT|nr:Uncharacterized protein dnm_037270 [Desulfonema magnum]
MKNFPHKISIIAVFIRNQQILKFFPNRWKCKNKIFALRIYKSTNRWERKNKIFGHPSFSSLHFQLK